MANRKSAAASEWQAILERIESQHRMTIEAVEASRSSIEARFQAAEVNLGGRLEDVERAMTLIIGRVDRLGDRMDRFGDRMDRLAERMDRLAHRPHDEEP